MPHGPVELRGIEGLTPERMRLIQRYLSRPGDYMYAPSLPIDATPFPESIPKEKVYGTADPIFGPTPSRDIVGNPQQAISNAYMESSEPGQPGLYDRALGLGRIAGDVLITRGGFGTPYESSRRLLRSADIPDLSRSQINQLAINAQAGDEAAKAQLFDQLQPIFVNLAQKYKAPATELEDFVMMANEEVLRHLPKYNAERGDFVTLAQRFGQRAMSNYAQRSTTQSRRATTTKGVKGRLDPLEADKPIGQSAEGEDLLLADTLEDVAQRRGDYTEADMQKMYDQAMASMTEPQKRAFTLRQQDLGEEQIATQMGVTRQAVNKHLAAAYRKIFDVTREMGFPAPDPPRPKGGYKAVRRPGLSDLRPEGGPEISGGSGVTPEDQVYVRDWSQAYNRYQGWDEASRRELGRPSGEIVEQIDDDYINLPPPLRPPLSPHQAATVDQLGVGRLRAPLKEPDPEIIRQIQGVNQNTAQIEFPEQGWYPTADFDERVRLSQIAGDQVADDLFKAGRITELEWGDQIPGMPLYHTSIEGGASGMPGRAIMDIKTDYYDPAWIQREDDLARDVQLQEDVLSRQGINLDEISPEEAASLGWTRGDDGVWRYFEGLRSFPGTWTQPRWPEGSAFESVNQLRPGNVRFGLGNLPSGDPYGP